MSTLLFILRLSLIHIPLIRIDRGIMEKNHIDLTTMLVVTNGSALHAGVFIVMEGADAHPVSSYPDTVMLGGLPGGNRLLHDFKYVQ